MGSSLHAPAGDEMVLLFARARQSTVLQCENQTLGIVSETFRKRDEVDIASDELSVLCPMTLCLQFEQESTTRRT